MLEWLVETNISGSGAIGYGASRIWKFIGVIGWNLNFVICIEKKNIFLV